MRPSPHADDWAAAACHGWDPDLWFPEPSARRQAADAKQICRRCTLRLDCLRQGMSSEYGIFGGLDASERRVLRGRAPGRAA